MNAVCVKQDILRLAPPAIRSQPRFGKSLWDLGLAQNQVWNRLFIDMIGYHGPSMLTARNKFERLEIFWDWLCWVTIATGMPILLGKLFNGLYASKLLKPLGIKHPLPLNIPFERVDTAMVKTKAGLSSLQKLLESATATQTQKAARLILNGKLFIMALDLLFLAIKGQAGHWGKNVITEKLSGKKGFSGEFNYTSDAFRQAKSAEHEQNKFKKWLISLGWGGFGLITLPTAVSLFLKNPALGKAKTRLGKPFAWFIQKLNYHNAIYMSKYLILWHSLFNFVAPTLLSARDAHEFRERLNKAIAIEFFFFIGDDVITGAAARFLQNRHVKALRGFKLWEKGMLGLPHAVPYTQLATRPVAHPGYKAALDLSRKAFWTGLIGTGLFLGVALNLINNWYTRKKVLAEQQAFYVRQTPRKPQRHTPGIPTIFSAPTPLFPGYPSVLNGYAAVPNPAWPSLYTAHARP